MDYERQSKYSQPLINKQDKLDEISLDIQLLNMMCRYITSKNLTVRRGQLINMRNFIYGIDPSVYNNDIDKQSRVDFIKKGLEARLDYNLTDPYTIIKHINGGIFDTSVIDLNNYQELPDADIMWLNNMISEALKFKTMTRLAKAMYNTCGKFLSSDYGSKSKILGEFEDINKRVQNEFRKSRTEDLEESEFSLRAGAFENSIYDIHRSLTSPRNLIMTGMQGLNELLGGGLEAGRVYAFFGLPGEGKSTILLNLAYQIKKYNKRYRTKDPTKRPCIVLLTMENKIKETVNRLFNIVAAGDSFKRHSPNEIIDIFRGQGELYIADDSPIDIYIKYQPSFSVDTSYLYTISEDLEDQGYEVICMIQDYIGRIRSIDHSQDTRIEYGNVTDEFKVFASVKDIPVVTASQLNRDASKHIDEGRSKNKVDLVRTIGRSNISESMLILNNLDGAYIIAPEFTKENKKFLGVQKIKARYETSKLDYIYLPFKENNEIALEEDYGLAVPTFKKTLMEGLTFQTASAQSSYHSNKINEIGSGMKQDSEENIFMKSQFSGSSSSVDIGNLLEDNTVAHSSPWFNNVELINPLIEEEYIDLIDPLI